MKTTWILVADEANARILEKTKAGPLLEVAKMRDFKAARAEDRKRMRRQKGMSQPPTSPEEERHHHAQAFAEQVALRLEEYRDEDRFTELHVVAAPGVFGYLRPEMAPSVKSSIVQMLGEDMVHASNDELSHRLFDAPAV